MKIGIIGAGNLGQSIAKGILHSDGATSMYLSKRNTASLDAFKKFNQVTITTENEALVKHSDILIFAVQPGQFQDILTEIKEFLTEKHVLISTITGFSIQKIEALIGHQHFIVRAMPNTAISVGASMTCLCANEAGAKRIAIAKAIFDRMGKTMTIPETKMQAATVIGASGIAFWMRLIRANSQGGVQLGFEAHDALGNGRSNCLRCCHSFTGKSKPSGSRNRSGHHPAGLHHFWIERNGKLWLKCCVYSRNTKIICCH